jgi:competence protein ComGF
MESTEGTSRVTPLSSALSRRRENSKIQTTEEQLRSIFEDVVQEHISAKMTRLEQSINRMISQFEAIHNGDADEAALRVTTDHDAVDLPPLG